PSGWLFANVQPFFTAGGHFVYALVESSRRSEWRAVVDGIESPSFPSPEKDAAGPLARRDDGSFFGFTVRSGSLRRLEFHIVEGKSGIAQRSDPEMKDSFGSRTYPANGTCRVSAARRLASSSERS